MMSPMMSPFVMGMHHGMAAAPSDEPSIDRKGRQERDRQRQGEAPPKKRVSETGVHRAGNDEHDRIIDDLHDRDGDRISGKGQGSRRPESHAGLEERV